MNDMIKHAEILAPAGGEEQLVAAVRSGADAVYLGVGNLFNARRGAKNFDHEGLCRAVEYCRERGVRVYAALNTLITDDETEPLLSELDAVAVAGVDAVIVQDLAVAALVRRRWPALPLHASTQLCVHNADGAKELEKLGFSQVVLARELSLDEIRKIKEKCGIDLEVFIHGALCMCVSGACYLSSVIGARSGNRGLCAQPCRTDFKLGGRHFALSLKDLCGIEHIAELENIGVRTLKIEGRMKRPEYVAAAVAACKTAQNGGKPDIDLLRRVFSRSGFTDGYLTGRRDHGMFGSRTKDDVTAMQGVLPGLAVLYAREPRTVPVDMRLTVREGEPSVLTVTDGVNTVSVNGAVPEAAGRATDAKAFRESLAKTGGTPYFLNDLSADIGEGLSLGAADRNFLRRTALERLSALRRGFAGYKMADATLPAAAPHISDKNPALRLRFESAGQVFPTDAADEIVLPVNELIAHPEAVEGFRGRVIAELPGLCFEADRGRLEKQLEQLKKMGLRDVLGGNIGYVEAAAEHGLILHGDYGLNVLNSTALSELEKAGFADATLSFELKMPRVRAMGGSLKRGIIAYGYLPLMKMRACPAKSAAGCAGCRGENVTTDSKGAKFTLICREKQYTELLNSVPLYIADKPIAGVDFLTLRFTTEKRSEAERVFGDFLDRRPPSFPRTCGLYYRELL